jgi:hypothetical protein
MFYNMLSLTTNLQTNLAHHHKLISTQKLKQIYRGIDCLAIPEKSREITVNSSYTKYLYTFFCFVFIENGSPPTPQLVYI